MDTIYSSKNMLKNNSLNTYKVLFSNFNLIRNVLHLWWFFYKYYSFLSSGEAESGLERLHQCAEKELQLFLNADGPSKDFNDFRTKLAGLTR